MKAAVTALAAVLVLVAAGCAGKATVVSGDGGSTGDSGGGGPGGCPSSQPTAGASCPTAGLVCGYGNDPRYTCRPTFACTGGSWQPQMQGPCPPLPGVMCPASRQAAQGQQCAPSGAICTYDQGLNCLCTDCPPGGPTCRPTPTPQWYCDAPNPDPQCPPAPENQGTACSPEGKMCNYGCGNAGDLVCTSGVWVARPSPCPVSSRLVKKDIRYLDDDDRARLAAEVHGIKLATYEYTDPALAGHRRLGFILEDDPMSYAADAEHNRVDLYGYASMLAATVQQQDRRIEALEREVQALKTPRKGAR
jgi:hypothetical protein